MAKVKYIRCDIYKRGISVFIGSPEELRAWCKKTYNEDKDDEDFNKSLEECSYGAADFHYGAGYAVVRLPKFPKTPMEIAYTAHELLHATQWLLWYSGVNYDNCHINNEAYTYLHEHLVRNTFEKKKRDTKMWKKIKNFFMDWVWQLPQNLLGLGYKLAIHEDILDDLTNTDKHYTIYLKDTNGGVTLGKYIFVYRRFNNLAYVVKHESGHVKQSRMLGPLYLLVIGLPSILWAATHRVIAPEKDYYWFYTENWANKLAGIQICTD